MIDFDDFKGINDQNDHAFGYHVLLWFARTLKSRLRDFDIPARLGGDEFAVLLPNTRLNDAVTIAERIGEAVSGTPIEDRGHRCQLTVSIGAVSWNPEGKRTFDEELKGADRALLDAKKLGRNRICTYDGQVKPHEPGAAAKKGSKKGSLKR
jgi:diguanylate cyclase (GGDEF)-like protein